MNMDQSKTHFPIVTITNFKRFNKKIKFELKPITILVGPNGKGKSTIIEALDIFSKSLRVFSTSEQPQDFLNNYSFDELISDKNKRKFEFSVNSQFLPRDSDTQKEKKIENIAVALSYKNNGGNPVFDQLKYASDTKSTDREFSINNKFNLNIFLSSSRKFKLTRFESLLESLKYDLPYTFLEEIIYNHGEPKELLPDIYERLKIYRTRTNFSAKYTEVEKLITNLSYGLLTNNFFIDDLISDKNILTLLVYLLIRDKDHLNGVSFEKLSELCESSFENFQILIDGLDDVETNIGTERLLDDTRKPPPKYFVVTNNTIREEEDFYGLAAFLLGIRKDPIDYLPGFRNRKKILEYWLAEFEIADKISIKQIEKIKPNTKLFEIMLHQNKRDFNLSSLSSGGKQVIPVILNCLMFNLAMYLRQPELHLHPKLQSKLAKLFKYVKDKVEAFFIVIETHSEHLIRKIQLMIANDELQTNLVAIYYLDGERIKKMELDDNGLLLENWPSGFFDEKMDLTLNLLDAVRSRNN